MRSLRVYLYLYERLDKSLRDICVGDIVARKNIKKKRNGTFPHDDERLNGS